MASATLDQDDLDLFEDPRDDDLTSLDPATLESRLLQASRNGIVSEVEQLLEKQADGEISFNVNTKGTNKANRGWTALHLASYFGHLSVAEALMQHGADTNVQNDSGDSPLHRAAYTGREDMVTLLIKYGADVTQMNAESHSPKDLARSPNTKRLIQAAEQYETKKTESTFLRAAREGNMDTLTTLLRQRKPGNVSCTDHYGNSALHCAAYCGRKEVAVALIQNGIDSSLRNAKGQTAEDLARDPQMKKLLSLSPVKSAQRNVQRFEGPLLKKGGVWGWRPTWVVLEKGVLSMFRNRADATTGVRRRGFKYLNQAQIKAPSDNANQIQIRLHDASRVTFSVEMDSAVHINRQKWVSALRDHVDYSRQWASEGATVSDDEDDEVMPLGALHDVLQTAGAHQQLMERHLGGVTTTIDHILTDQDNGTQPEVVLAKLHTDLVTFKESSQEMMDAMSHALTIMTQQDKVRSVQLHQESERSRVLQDALRVLAEEHHSLEQSIRSRSPSPGVTGATARDVMGNGVTEDESDDEDEFHDCLEASYSGLYSSAAETLMNGEREASLVCSRWGARTSLPAMMFSRNDFSVWSILKQCIGKELSKITMPVIFNEPLSFLQRVVEYMEYTHLLQKAVDCDDPIKRLEYVTAFAVSATASNWERIGKPFNPLLGETYELHREDLGFRIVCEQVSHHPPVSAFHASSQQFTLHGAIHPKLKFWGKSIEVTPRGLVTLTLHKHNEVYTWQNVNCCIHNIIVGKIWIEHYGTMEVHNVTTKHKASLMFKPSGWFSKELHRVEGFIYDGSKRKVKAFFGKWIDAFYSYDISVWENFSSKTKKSPTAETAPTTTEHATPSGDADGDNPPPLVKGSSCDLQLPGQHMLWQATPKPANSKKYYSFTEFALMLNEMKDADTLPPTDCRRRPDMRNMEEGNMDVASSEKNRVEEKQRTARKERKRRKDEWTPRWFKQGTNPHTGKEDWMYNGEYFKRDWSQCPDIF